MTLPIQIWTRTAWHPAFKCGGWAFVRSGVELLGKAGGDRNTSPQRMGLAGLTASLTDLPSGPVAIDIEDRGLAQTTAKILSGANLSDAERPTEDLELWAQLITALKGRSVRFKVGALSPGGPAAFAQAWADLAMDKAKTAGPFTAAIPKPNLARVKV
ncbi:MAG: hypothetical protein CGW95_07695 [Phenylobacterium zucineum]|nr:MAG: hypothetical protein CGW95_07695 [Phenylobacterium zucineum]